jgi:NO-binding membrane sensor protein with MHYT domain
MSPLDSIVGTYDHLLVVLSAGIAVLASYTALDLAERVSAARGKVRLAWLLSGGLAMGIGIWSMHYTAMLALRLPVEVLYDWPTATLSLLLGIVSSIVALLVVSLKRLGAASGLAGGILQGAGIATLHYTSMAAMRLPWRDRCCRYG